MRNKVSHSLTKDKCKTKNNLNGIVFNIISYHIISRKTLLANPILVQIALFCSHNEYDPL